MYQGGFELSSRHPAPQKALPNCFAKFHCYHKRALYPLKQSLSQNGTTKAAASFVHQSPATRHHLENSHLNRFRLWRSFSFFHSATLRTASRSGQAFQFETTFHFSKSRAESDETESARFRDDQDPIGPKTTLISGHRPSYLAGGKWASCEPLRVAACRCGKFFANHSSTIKSRHRGHTIANDGT